MEGSWCADPRASLNLREAGTCDLGTVLCFAYSLGSRWRQSVLLISLLASATFHERLTQHSTRTPIERDKVTGNCFVKQSTALC